MKLSRILTGQIALILVLCLPALDDAAGTQVAASTNGDATADQASWTNTGTSAVNVDIRVHRYSTTRTTCQLRVSY